VDHGNASLSAERPDQTPGFGTCRLLAQETAEHKRVDRGAARQAP
jgi:hypothetical protein